MTFTFDDWKAGAPIPKGWDCADAIDDGWTKEHLDTFMRKTARPWVPREAGKPAGETDPIPEPEPRPSSKPPAAVTYEARAVEQAKPAARSASNVIDMRTRLTLVDGETWQGKLKFGDNGLRPTVQLNWALHLENHDEMEGVFSFNNFKRHLIVRAKPPWEVSPAWKQRAIKDSDYAEAAMWLEDKGMSPSVSKVFPIVQAVAERNMFDPLLDYLNGLEWDGTPRAAMWLSYYLGVEDTIYTRAVAKKTLISAVARAIEPGCKCDTMIILEGEQGLNKSSVLKALFSSDFFTDEISDLASKDASLELQGVWCVELAEMARIISADPSQVKKFITRQIDRYRPPYGRSVIEAPRRTILAGTINPDGNPYLRDPTGARRFWPVFITSIDQDGIKQDRDQLWAEAVHLYKSGASWWFDAEEEAIARIEQAKRTNVDAWTDVIAVALEGRSKVTQTEIISTLGIETKHLDNRHVARVARIMRTLGWTMSRDSGLTRYTRQGAGPKMADNPADW